MKSILKTLFTLVALAITLGLGYFLYVQRGQLEDTSNFGDSTTASIKAAKFLNQLNDLKTIELSGDLLSDGRFSSLVQFSSPIQSEEIGRQNPFESN
jgi:hypothetical protein